MVAVNVAPQVFPDGSWMLPELPNAVFGSDVAVPFQSSGIQFETGSTYNQGSDYSGPVQAIHVGNITGIPDVGVPGTGLGVKFVMRDHLCDAVAAAYDQAGHNVLGVAMAEYNTGFDGPIATLGYELEIITGDAGVLVQMLPAGQAVVTTGTLFRRQPQAQRVADAQFVGLIVVIVSILVGLGIDAATGGKISTSFGRAVESVGAAVGNAVKPLTQGPTYVLLAGGALLLAAAYFLNNNPEFGGKGLDQASEVFEKSGKIRDATEPTQGLRSVKAVKDVL